MRDGLPFVLSLLTLLCACAEPAPPATPAAEELPPVERGPEYDFPLGPRLFDLWRQDAPHAHPTSSLLRGRLAPGRPAENLVVLTGVRCYQILAVVERSTPGLRLTLFDPTGVPQVRAEGDADSLSLGHDEPICPGAPGRYRLRLEGDGDAAYALRVYGAMSL